ncbi:MAG: hypothetical protein QOK28_2781, partial [Actinomycetota bacterium]
DGSLSRQQASAGLSGQTPLGHPPNSVAKTLQQHQVGSSLPDIDRPTPTLPSEPASSAVQSHPPIQRPQANTRSWPGEAGRPATETLDNGVPSHGRLGGASFLGAAQFLPHPRADRRRPDGPSKERMSAVETDLAPAYGRTQYSQAWSTLQPASTASSWRVEHGYRIGRRCCARRCRGRRGTKSLSAVHPPLLGSAHEPTKNGVTAPMC